MKQNESKQPKKVTKLKIYFLQNGVQQNELAKKSGVGITTLHWLINTGNATPKTFRKVTECLVNDYKLPITIDEVKEYATTEV